MNHNLIFITGTDTDVGKSIISAAMLRNFIKKNISVKSLKPVQTGSVINNKTLTLEAPDVAVYKRALEGVVNDPVIPEPSYSYKTPCSPHLASEIESDPIDFEKFVSDIEEKTSDDSLYLIEGAGGIYTPLNRQYNYLDVIKRLEPRVVLVADNKLGMLNHSCQTIDLLQMNGLEILTLVINHCHDYKNKLNQKICEDNIHYLKKKYEDIIITTVPYMNEIDSSHKQLEEEAWDNLSKRFSNLTIPGYNEKREAQLANIDRTNIFHPYTSLSNPLKTYKIKRAEGNYLYSSEGRLLDGMSSWWCTVHGYSNKEINRAAIKQINQFSHVMFGGITHDPVLKLTEKLIDMVPGGLEKVFYCDSGSVAVEVALKMALQYWQGTGHIEKRRILAFEGAYHGDTFGAMSVCDPLNGMHHLFSGFLAKQIFAKRPSCPFGQAFNPESLDNVKGIIESQHHLIAALIIEPIVQGAGGMWIYHPEYLKGLRELCTRFNILLICDEIATGFGRTGKLFASEWSPIEPDIMCMGKALSGGYLSFAATWTNNKVAMGISEQKDVFMHGPTFMANPLACSIACSSIDLLKKNGWKKQVLHIESSLNKHLIKCLDLSEVQDVRILGAIGVVELDKTVDLEEIQEFFVKEGVWIRPYGKIIYIMPPYACSDKEIQTLCDAIYKAILNNKYRKI